MPGRGTPVGWRSRARLAGQKCLSHGGPGAPAQARGPQPALHSGPEQAQAWSRVCRRVWAHELGGPGQARCCSQGLVRSAAGSCSQRLAEPQLLDHPHSSPSVSGLPPTLRVQSRGRSAMVAGTSGRLQSERSRYCRPVSADRPCRHRAGAGVWGPGLVPKARWVNPTCPAGRQQGRARSMWGGSGLATALQDARRRRLAPGKMRNMCINLTPPVPIPTPNPTAKDHKTTDHAHTDTVHVTATAFHLWPGPLHPPSA